MKRGDVVLAIIPYLEGDGAKRRPVVVIQADRFNRTSRDTVVAAITSNASHAGPANRLLIDPSSADGAQTGLYHPSVIECDRLLAISQRTIGRALGSLSAADLGRIESCLKASLDLP